MREPVTTTVSTCPCCCAEAIAGRRIPSASAAPVAALVMPCPLLGPVLPRTHDFLQRVTQHDGAEGGVHMRVEGFFLRNLFGLEQIEPVARRQTAFVRRLGRLRKENGVMLRADSGAREIVCLRDRGLLEVLLDSCPQIDMTLVGR